MNKIVIDYGLYTALTIDLTEFDFTGITKIVLTCCNPCGNLVFQREYDEPKLYNEIITPEESKKLEFGASYDFKKVMSDGKTYKMGDNGYILIRMGCGQCQ